MALVNNKQVLEGDSWYIVRTDNLSENTLTPTISLSELLSGREKRDIILPISSVLNTESLAKEMLQLIKKNSGKIAVWVGVEHDHLQSYQSSPQQLDDLLKANSKKGQKTNPLLAEIVSELELIVLDVPAFAYGRAFSLAEHLRLQEFNGEIRLTGEFGRDQLAYYQRSGISTYVVDDAEVTDDFFNSFSDLKSAPAGKSVNSLPMFAD